MIFSITNFNLGLFSYSTILTQSRTFKVTRVAVAKVAKVAKVATVPTLADATF